MCALRCSRWIAQFRLLAVDQSHAQAVGECASHAGPSSVIPFSTRLSLLFTSHCASSRFSAAFVLGERSRLYKYRRDVRRFQQGQVRTRRLFATEQPRLRYCYCSLLSKRMTSCRRPSHSRSWRDSVLLVSLCCLARSAHADRACSCSSGRARDSPRHRVGSRRSAAACFQVGCLDCCCA